MKNIYYMLTALFALSLAFTSCKDEDPFATISPDDDPMILDPVFPDRTKGELPVISQISRDANFTMKLTVTPSEYTEVTWEIDGTEIHQGKDIEVALEAGTYHVKMIATTIAGKSTYREGNVIVNPLEGDPHSEAVGTERIVAPGAIARLYGTNLDLVKEVVIGNKTVSSVTVGESDLGNYVEYEVPADISDGKHRISLVDAEGNSYGGNLTTVVSTSAITGGFERTTAGREWLMTGVNLDKVATLYVNGEAISEFVRQSSTEIAIVCPSLEDGEYTLKGVSKDGTGVLFYSANEMLSEVLFAVTSETVLWEGHHYVSWDLADGDPNKMFNLIPLETFNTIIPGSVMKINYSINPADKYHQLRTTTVAWNDLPGTSAMDFSENGVIEVVLAQDALSMIRNEGGFLCVGHGYYVDMITVK